MPRAVSTARLANGFQHGCSVRVCLPIPWALSNDGRSRYGMRNSSNTSRPEPTNAPQPNPNPNLSSKPKRSRTGRNAIMTATGILGGWLLASYLRQPEISPDGFVRYTLTDRQTVSPTCSIFSLKPSKRSAAIDFSNPALSRAVTSVEFKQPQLQIARSYTILPPAPGQADDELRFLIRKERNGEVSGYLHRLPEGSEIEVRGPFVESALPDDVARVVFLAGGTGIAPAMRVAHTLQRDERANVRILWANRAREDCIGGQGNRFSQDTTTGWWSNWWQRSTSLRQQEMSQDTEPRSGEDKSTIVQALDQMAYSTATAGTGEDRIQVEYFVDEEGTFIKPDIVKRLLQHGNSRTNDDRQALLFVSGPEGFITYWAGAKEWVNGREVQGPVRGEVGKMQPLGWTVIKL
ncbi:hypothetical protein K431DRAFT_285559, partial [Polychaeton citri CBS 116435]